MDDTQKGELLEWTIPQIRAPWNYVADCMMNHIGQSTSVKYVCCTWIQIQSCWQRCQTAPQHSGKFYYMPLARNTRKGPSQGSTTLHLRNLTRQEGSSTKRKIQGEVRIQLLYDTWSVKCIVMKNRKKPDNLDYHVERLPASPNTITVKLDSEYVLQNRRSKSTNRSWGRAR